MGAHTTYTTGKEILSCFEHDVNRVSTGCLGHYEGSNHLRMTPAWEKRNRDRIRMALGIQFKLLVSAMPKVIMLDVLIS